MTRLSMEHEAVNLSQGFTDESPLFELSRGAISAYTHRFYGFQPDPDTRITVSLGATEGLSSVMRTVCNPGDEVVFFQPFHEMYPGQAELFGVEPRYVTLREDPALCTWIMTVMRCPPPAGREPELCC